MNRLPSALALAVLSGIALVAPAEAASYHHGNGKLTASERAAIARSQHHLNIVKARVRADGHVSPWERVKIRVAQGRHAGLVYRLRHN